MVFEGSKFRTSISGVRTVHVLQIHDDFRPCKGIDSELPPGLCWAQGNSIVIGAHSDPTSPLPTACIGVEG